MTDKEELAELLRHTGELDFPQVMTDNCTEFWADADELRAWRASQNTSAAEPK